MIELARLAQSAQIKCSGKLIKYFKKKDPRQLPTFKIPTNKEHLIHKARIDSNLLNRDNNGNFLLSKTTEKLDYLGTQYAAVGDQNENLNNPKFRNIVEKRYSQIISEINDNIPITISKFSKENSAILTNKAPEFFRS